jgi:hypothetical protein
MHGPSCNILYLYLPVVTESNRESTWSRSWCVSADISAEYKFKASSSVEHTRFPSLEWCVGKAWSEQQKASQPLKVFPISQVSGYKLFLLRSYNIQNKSNTILIHSCGPPNVNTVSISCNGQVIKVDLKRTEEKDQLSDDSRLFQGGPC